MTAADLQISRQSRPVETVVPIYLYGAAFDLVFVCGGWLLALVAANFVLSGGSAAMSRESVPALLRVFVLAGTYLLAQPHSAATLFKLYAERTAFRHKREAFVLPVILAGLLAAALYLPALARLEATLYVALALHHIMAQCYGIGLMYCTRAGVRLSQRERLFLQAALWASVAAAVAQQLSSNWHSHTFLDIELFQFSFVAPEFVSLLQFVAFAAMVALVCAQYDRLIQNKPLLPLPACVTMLVAVTLLTIWSTATELVWLFVPAFFHGSQYLCVVMAYFLKQLKDENPQAGAAEIRQFVAQRSAELFIAGLLLFVALPKLISSFGAPFALSSSLVFFAISLHHFAADACIWKLRDPEVRRTLPG